jgi:hypothetical protein
MPDGFHKLCLSQLEKLPNKAASLVTAAVMGVNLAAGLRNRARSAINSLKMLWTIGSQAARPTLGMVWRGVDHLSSTTLRHGTRMS